MRKGLPKAPAAGQILTPAKLLAKNQEAAGRAKGMSQSIAKATSMQQATSHLRRGK